MFSPRQLFDRAPVTAPARWLLAASLAAWLGAAVAIAFGQGALGAGLVVAGWLLGGLGEARARAEGRDETLRLPLGLLLVPFGFALADPSRALAAMFLLLALSVWATQGRLLGREPLGLVVTLGYVTAALLPYHFSFLAYLIGVIVFVMAEEGARR